MMEFIVQTYFDQLDGVRFAAPKATNPLAFRHCNPNEIVPANGWQSIDALPPVIGTTSAGMAQIGLVMVLLNALGCRLAIGKSGRESARKWSWPVLPP